MAYFSLWNLYGIRGDARPGRTLWRSARVVVCGAHDKFSAIPRPRGSTGARKRTFRNFRCLPPASRYCPWTDVTTISSPAWFASRTSKRFFEWPFWTPGGRIEPVNADSKRYRSCRTGEQRSPAWILERGLREPAHNQSRRRSALSVLARCTVRHALLTSRPVHAGAAVRVARDSADVPVCRPNLRNDVCVHA